MTNVRMRGAWLSASMMVAVCAAGCDESEDDTSEGDESEGDELDQLYSWPCQATRGDESKFHCSWDTEDGAYEMTCSELEGLRWWRHTRVLSADSELTRLTRVLEFRLGPEVPDHDEAETWELGDIVTRTHLIADDAVGNSEIVETYEREGFQLLGHPFDPDQLPAAPDSLVEHRSMSRDDPSPEVTVIDYSYDGPPRTGTRVRTGSDGTAVEFRYDTVGRLVGQSETRDGALYVDSYEYDGEVLSEIDHSVTVEGSIDSERTTFEHDRHGNVITKQVFNADPPLETTEYEYTCWTMPFYRAFGPTTGSPSRRGVP